MPGPGAFLVGEEERREVEEILESGYLSRYGSLDNPNRSTQWTGRTSTNKIVNFLNHNAPGGSGDIFPGKPVSVKIEKAYAHSLWGKPIEIDSKGEDLKGEKSYAA